MSEDNTFPSWKDREGCVCKDCVKNREWLLKCIRFSEKAARYVAARETEEAPERKAKVERSIEVAQLSTNQAQSSESERLGRLEALIEKLVSGLGGV